MQTRQCLRWMQALVIVVRSLVRRSIRIPQLKRSRCYVMLHWGVVCILDFDFALGMIGWSLIFNHTILNHGLSPITLTLLTREVSNSRPTEPFMASHSAWDRLTMSTTDWTVLENDSGTIPHSGSPIDKNKSRPRISLPRSSSCLL